MRALECHLRFCYWNPVTGSERPLPDGLLVRVWEYDPESPDDLLGSGRVAGGDGRVHIVVADRDEDEAEVWFELVTEEAEIDLVREVLVPSGVPAQPGARLLPLPVRWSSRNAFAVGSYEAGCLRVGPDRPALGSPTEPLTYRVFFDCFLRFVYWNERRRAYVGLPAGVTVEACDRQLIGADRLLGRAPTDAAGNAHLRLAPDHELRPDLYFRYRLPEDAPAAVDLETGGFTDPSGGAALPIPREWSSRDAWRLEEHSARGYWDEYEGSRIGIAANPCVFDVHAGEPPFFPGTRATALVDGDRTWPRLLAAIRGARRSVHVQAMLFFADAIGDELAAALAEKAREDVPVRVLFDARTTGENQKFVALKRVWARTALELDDAARAALLAALDEEVEAEEGRGDTGALVARLEAAGVQVCDSRFPRVHVLPRAPEGAPPLYAAVEEALPFFTVARIDHRKLVVVDGTRAFLGGMNVGREYLYEDPFDPTREAAEEARTARERWAKWHDCFVELEGPAVARVQHLFRERWVLEGGDAFVDDETRPDRAPHAYFPDLPPLEGGVPVRIVDTTPGARTWVHQQYLSLIDRARREILIENPYFSSPEVLHHVTAAARRGVSVTWVFPDAHNDSYDFLYAARLKYRALLEAGVAVFEYRNHMTHAKVAVIDDVTIIGSPNLNHAGLFNHYEIAAVIADAEWTRRFRAELFERDLAASDRIGLADLERLLTVNALGRAWCRHFVDVFF